MKIIQSNQSKPAGFTFTELLVVLAMVGLLAVVALPALAGNRTHNLGAQCLDNERRLAGGWIQYAADHDDKIMAASGTASTLAWVAGQMTWDPNALPSDDNFNSKQLTDPSLSAMAAYVRSASVYKCPAEQYKLPQYPSTRVRSVSMNCNLSAGSSASSVLGNGPAGDRTYYGTGSASVGSSAKKMSDLNLPGPAMTYLILDEFPDGINSGVFSFHPGAAPTGAKESWQDLPATYHEGAAGISFADGHAEMHQWQQRGDPLQALSTTFWPVKMATYAAPPPWDKVMNNSVDYEWLDERTPYQKK